MSLDNRAPKIENIVWYDRVDGLISALRVLAQYLEDGPKDCLTGRQLLRARRLLGVHGEDSKWRLDMINWRERLELAGICPRTFQVKDERRFAYAMDYMRATETFRADGFMRWMLEHDEPSAVPARDVPARPHPRARKKLENAGDRLINERIRDKTG